MASDVLWDMQYTGNADDGIITFALRGANALIDLVVKPDSLKGHPNIRKLLRLIERINEGDCDAEESFMDVIADDCQHAVIHYGKMNSSDKVKQDTFTLQDYYGIKVTCLELSVRDGKFRLRPRQDQCPQPDLLPAMATSVLASHTTISVPMLDAARVRTMPWSRQEPGEYAIAEPTLVQASIASGTSKAYYFKPVILEQIGVRELKILFYLKQHQLNLKHRVPSIAAIIHYAGEPSRILGFLLEWIDDEGNLDDRIRDKKIPGALKEKWAGQTRNTV